MRLSRGDLHTPLRGRVVAPEPGSMIPDGAISDRVYKAPASAAAIAPRRATR